MPTFKDPECTKLYMRIYMRRLRLKRRIEHAALIQSRRIVFLERERQIKAQKALFNRVLSETSLEERDVPDAL